MRSDGSDVPVVFLTARDATADRLRGLTIGGDDYLTKPFSIEELVARVQVILRRVGKARRRWCSPPATSSSTTTPTSCEGGVEVALSPTEYKLLRFLMRNPGPGAVTGPDPRPRVGLRLRRRVDGRRDLRVVAAPQGGPGGTTAPA
jgi:DNA-binding response OmpR family regulator